MLCSLILRCSIILMSKYIFCLLYHNLFQLPLVLLLLCMLLISRSMDLWEISISSIDKLSFTSILIFNFLLLLFPSSVLHWHEGDNFFSEYDQSNWIFYVEYYLEVFSSPLFVELVH